MTVILDIPDQAQALLQAAFGQNLSRPALEAMAADGYRMGKLTRFNVQSILGFDNRWEAEEWLGEHGLNMHYSVDDLEADARTLDKLLGPV